MVIHDKGHQNIMARESNPIKKSEAGQTLDTSQRKGQKSKICCDLGQALRPNSMSN